MRRGFCTFVLFNSLTVFNAGLPQCFSNTNCTGAVVDAADQRDCCVGTDDGLSYHNGTNCHLCIGIFLTLAAHARARGIALGLCVCVCVCVCVCMSADPCPPFFSTTVAGLSFKRGYVFR